MGGHFGSHPVEVSKIAHLMRGYFEFQKIHIGAILERVGCCIGKRLFWMGSH